MKLNLEEAGKMVLQHGPNRVILSKSGEGFRRDHAARAGVTIDIVFIRDDGWALGAPAEFEAVAYGMWKKNWIGFIRFPDQTAHDIKEYGTKPAAPPEQGTVFDRQFDDWMDNDCQGNIEDY